MTWLVRLKYTMYLFIAITMTVMLLLSIGEGLGLLVGLPTQNLPFHPAYFLPVAVGSYLLAPSVARRLPLSGAKEQIDRPTTKPEFGYGVRVGALFLVAVTSVAVLSAVLWLIK